MPSKSHAPPVSIGILRAPAHELSLSRSIGSYVSEAEVVFGYLRVARAAQRLHWKGQHRKRSRPISRSSGRLIVSGRGKKRPPNYSTVVVVVFLSGERVHNGRARHWPLNK